MGKVIQTINDVETYTDDYGNVKQLTVDDHSTKIKTSFLKLKKEEYKNILNDLKKTDESYKNIMLSINNDVFFKLLNMYSHFILYDENVKKYKWDDNKLNTIYSDRDTLWAIGRYIEKLNNMKDETNI